MRRGLQLVFVLMSLGLLAGCGGFGGGPSAPILAFERTVSASTSPESPINTVSLEANEFVLYTVNVPDAVVTGGDTVWFEAQVRGDSDSVAATLYLDNNDGSTYAFSSSRTNFRAGPGAVTPSSSDSFVPQALDVELACRGPCVIVESVGSEETVRIHNRSSARITVDFFVYPEDLQDTNEPANDFMDTAPGIGRGGSEEGAIEVLGDSDFYFATSSGRLTLTGGEPADLEARILDSNQRLLGSVRTGQSIQVQSGEYIEVRSRNHRFAGPPNNAAAAYTLRIQ